MEDKYHVLDLPSKLKPYPGVKEISVRFLKGKDEKYVGDLSLTNFDKKYNLLLEQILKGISPKELTVGDRTYIAIWLSMNCYSHIYPIETICEHCFSQVKVKVDLQKLAKIELPEGFTEPYPVQLTDGTVVQMRLLRVKDQIAYMDYVTNKKEDNPNFKLALTIVDDKSFVDKLSFLDNLDVQNVSILRAFHDKHMHGIDLEDYEFECTRCKEVSKTLIPFRLELIFPDNETVADAAGKRV
jgi:hypothetical protein